MKFRPEMSIKEALRLHPGAREIFINFGMECVTCLGMELESIEDGAKMHSININSLIDELNRLIEIDTNKVKNTDE